MAADDFNRATGKLDTEEARRRALRMVKEKQFFEEKAGEYQSKIHSAQMYDRVDLDRKHDREQARLQEKLRDTYGEQKAKERSELKALREKAEKSKLSEQERNHAKALQKNLANGRQREKEQEDALKTRQTEQKKALEDKHKTQTEQSERTVQFAKQERQATGWKPAPVVFDEQAAKDSEISFQKPAQSATSSQGKETTSEGRSSSPRPYMAPRGARTGNLHPPEGKVTGQSVSGKGLEL